MGTIHKTLKYTLVSLLIVAGSAFFYMAGLGTGLYVAQSTALAYLPATATPVPPPDTPTPTWTPEALSPSATPVPTSTQTPTPLPTPTPSPTPRPSNGEENDFDIFWEAWDLLQDQFYGELPTEEELPYAAIRGVIASTGDQYTAFLDPVRAEIVRTDMSGSFEGIGATVRIRPDGKLEIVQPLPEHPAIKAGLRPGDVVLEVDGVELEGMNLYEAISLIRGPAGTTVRLLVEREEVEEPFEVEVTRARIEFPVVESEILDDDIAYLRLNDFGQAAPGKVEEALRDLLDANPRALIFDLRGNGGGYLTAAVEIASQFVADGPILIERFRDESERTYEAIDGGRATDIPLVVLVDGGTASASEIVAGAIQDTERGVLIGTKTLGKGSVQWVNTLSDGSQLRVTTAKWFTPDGRAIHGEGLTPDIELEITEEDLEADRDPQLDRAIAYLLEGK
jgi:carboxyl-terminal processing protease